MHTHQALFIHTLKCCCFFYSVCRYKCVGERKYLFLQKIIKCKNNIKMKE